MKVLVLVSRVPFPLEKGDKLRAYHQIKNLNKHHEIILVALNKGFLHPKAKTELQKICNSLYILPITNFQLITNSIKAFFKGLPIQSGYFYNSANQKKLNEIISDNHVEHIYSQLVRTTEYVKDFPIKKTLDYQDAFSAGMKRRAKSSSPFFKWFFKMESERLKDYEENIYEYFDFHTIISEADRDLLNFPKAQKIWIVPNGIDFDYFKPFESNKIYDLVFTGNMSYAPNVKAAKFLVQEIMPFVWNKKPDCKLLISGANPTKSVQRLGSKNVKIGGWIDDIRESYAQSKVFIAPMQIGTGLQNKLIEAMAMRLPCITSTLANRALKAVNSEDIMIGKTAREYANLVIQLLEDNELSAKIANKGYEFVHTHYSWENSTNILNQLIKDNVV